MRCTKTIACAVAVLAVLGGCAWDFQPAADTPDPPRQVPQREARYMGQDTLKDQDTRYTTAVQSALELSKKYAQASERLAQAQKENHDLATANQALQAKCDKATAELEQARKELADANTMLLELRRDLDKWKVNVIGFREEIRDAQGAQLLALKRILRLLGGQETESGPGDAAKAKVSGQTEGPSGASTE